MSEMRAPTPDQGKVLEDTARIRVVRAAPGSGKTWLLAEAVRRELAATTNRRCGIAALSFTRIGGIEIRDALRRDLGHPHFVGTLDSFFFRYVARPHIHLLYPAAKLPVKIVEDDWTHGKILDETRPHQYFWNGLTSEGKPRLVHKYSHGKPREVTDPAERNAVKKYKRDHLEKLGHITMNDATMLSWQLLVRYPVVSQEITRRFPTIFVDELQDTGLYHAQALVRLLERPSTRALLVGDPNQAIFEFNGAAPGEFGTFVRLPGAEELHLASSRRCSHKVATAASYLAAAPPSVCAVPGRDGAAFLVRYAAFPADLHRVAHAVASHFPGKVAKVVSRANATVEALAGDSAALDVHSLSDPAVTMLHRAVRSHRDGNPRSALGAAGAALGVRLFGVERVAWEKLAQCSVPPREWRAALVRLVLLADAAPASGTVFDWHSAAFQILEDECARLAQQWSLVPKGVARKPKHAKGHDDPMADSISARGGGARRSSCGLPVLSVHAVKGETHAVTVVVCPPSTKSKPDAKCPSTQWWPTGTGSGEEQRIAYVALTRAESDVVLCVDLDTDIRLSTHRPEFVAAFQRVTVDELIAHYTVSA